MAGAAPAALATGAERVVTGAATYEADGISLAGEAYDDGDAGTFTVEYGSSTTYGQTSDGVAVPASADGQPVSVKVPMVPGSNVVYHYRAVLTVGTGTFYGADATFTTPVGTTHVPTPTPTTPPSGKTTPPAPGPWRLPLGTSSPTRLTPQSRDVEIEFFSGGCINETGIVTTRTSDAVIITVFFSELQSTNGVAIPCPAPRATVKTVSLEGRLGRRKIEDGSSTPPAVRYPAAENPLPAVSILRAYARLHRRGLPITFDRTFPLTSESLYATGVKRATVVRKHRRKELRVSLKSRFQPVASLAVPTPIRSYRVPDFTGRPLSRATSWAQARGLRWQAARLPRLVHATRAHLLANYTVRHQSPKPGSELSLGHDVPSDTPGGHGFAVTPLKLRAR